IDCGMEQGLDVFENVELPVNPGEINYLLLTHAHIDHSGHIPLLVKQGFSGEIHSTDSTMDLCNIMLRDSAHIQEFEAETRNRKNQRAGKELYVPKYTMDDAIAALCFFNSCIEDTELLCKAAEFIFVFNTDGDYHGFGIFLVESFNPDSAYYLVVFLDQSGYKGRSINCAFAG
ncbi:MAG: MBL fold metallo-hydrolase, partial [Akkermansia sp.]|nr:MBL fold metallo-hydrolase [Akkermansia sp.]